MLLDSLKNFSWYNEPQNVRFVEEGMLVETMPQTDFWQAAHHGFFKDDGHFFYTEKQGRFDLVLKWRFGTAVASDQCGLMIRLNSRAWAKIGFLSPDVSHPQIGCVITSRGVSDWSAHVLPAPVSELWFKVICRGGDFIFFYSTDGKKFQQCRMFHLEGVEDAIKAGAYCCSPQNHKFECILENIE